jgi:Na+-translocating ferredoxin:NAD+ oxidoreductase RnfG subunit
MNGHPKGRFKRIAFAGAIVLAIISLASGASVGLMYHLFKDDIKAKEKEAFHKALADVLGEARTYPVVGQYDAATPDMDKVYENRTEGMVLYAAMGVAHGYQSDVRVLVSVKAAAPSSPAGDDPEIYRMTVVSSTETPGLGEEIKTAQKDVSIWAAIAGERQQEGPPKRPWFQEQFSGKRLSDLVVEKNPDTRRIMAVTGATITSKAATSATRNAVEKIVRKTAEGYGK